jgi:hypothetical protein
MATKLKTGHICPNKSAKDRATEFSKELYEESGLLFCRTCESSIDHKRKSTIIDHLESKKHKLRKEKKNSGPISNESTGGESSSTSGKRQSTIDRGFAVATTARDARHAVANDLVCAMVAANIPLEKADNPVLRDFFVKHVRNGGSISGSTAGVNLCGNGWERSSHTYFGVGTQFPHFMAFTCGNCVPIAFPHLLFSSLKKIAVTPFVHSEK